MISCFKLPAVHNKQQTWKDCRHKYSETVTENGSMCQPNVAGADLCISVSSCMDYIE